MPPRPAGGALAFVLSLAAAPLAGQAPDAGPALPVAIAEPVLAWPAERGYRARRPVETIRDSASGDVTTSIVVERGKYLLWMQRPRVTAASVRAPDLDAGHWPPLVYLEFRTQSPQYTATNLLVLTGDDSLRFEAAATASRIQHRTLVTEHTLTFAVPLGDFLRFAQARRGRLEVGGVSVALKPEHLESLRALAVRIHAAGEG
jgi:hypothetical protein